MEFDLVYRMYFQEVERYLLTLCRDSHLAEELTQQTFFKAMEALHGFRGTCDIRTWLCSIAKNCWTDHIRKQKPTQDIDNLCIQDITAGVEERLMDQDQTLEIHRVVHNLPEPYKEVFSLRVFGQLSFGEIGDLFGRNGNWACVTYHRARQKIKDKLEEWELPVMLFRTCCRCMQSP